MKLQGIELQNKLIITSRNSAFHPYTNSRQPCNTAKEAGEWHSQENEEKENIQGSFRRTDMTTSHQKQITTYLVTV